MRLDGAIIERRKLGDGYHYTSVCVSRLPKADNDSIVGISITVGVHQLVAYTFLGPPADEHDTVDHIDGIPENNFAGNLRWGNAKTQLENRKRTHVELTLPDGSQENNLAAAARELGVSRKTIVNQSRHCVDGDFDIVDGCGTMRKVKCKHLDSRPIQLHVQNPRPIGNQRTPPASLTPTRVLQEFIGGRTCKAIWTSWPTSVQFANVVGHIGRGVNASDVHTTAAFIKRVGISSPIHCQRLMNDIDTMVLEMKAKHPAPTREQWDARYAEVVLHHLPNLDTDDWIVIKNSRKALQTMIDQHRNTMDRWQLGFDGST